MLNVRGRKKVNIKKEDHIEFLKQVYRESFFYHNKWSMVIKNFLDNHSDILEKEDLEAKFFERRFSELPPLEKDEIINDALQIMMPEYLYKYKDNDFMPFWTSGSTGKCLELYWKLADCRRSLYPLWYYRYKFYGIYTWDKHIKFNTISGIENNEPWMVERDYSLEFSKSNLNEQKLLDIYKAIFDYKPVWLLLQPCIAELLCWVKEKNNLLTIDSVKYIECTGEMLSDELRMRLVKNFMCTVSNQYGMNEVNTIAYECPQGNMHCMESSVCVEILNNNGEVLPDNMEGNIYVTSWQNQVMPFIRYGTGDIGILRKNTCSCGHSGKLLNLRKGRKNDWILTKNGERINVYVFIRSIEIVNMLTEHSIIQFQIIQIDYEEFLVKMVLNDDILNISKLFIENIGHESLKQATYHFQLCEAIFPNETGKICVFSSALSKEGF